MVIRLSEIEDSTVLKGKMDGSSLQRAEDNDFRFAGPVNYALNIRKYDDRIQIKGTVGFVLTLICGRCLEDFEYPVQTNLDIELEPKASLSDVSELELKNDDLNVYYYEGDEIDLDPFVYDEVMLNIPMKPVCREECKGLCGVCGKNKNYEECRCNTVLHTVMAEKLKTFLEHQGDIYGSSKKKNVTVKKRQKKNAL